MRRLHEDVRLSGDPEAPVTVVITPEDGAARRPLASYIGTPGRGVHRSPDEVDDHIRRGREEWER